MLSSGNRDRNHQSKRKGHDSRVHTERVFIENLPSSWKEDLIPILIRGAERLEKKDNQELMPLEFGLSLITPMGGGRERTP